MMHGLVMADMKKLLIFNIAFLSMASVWCQTVNMCNQTGRYTMAQCFLSEGKLQAQQVLPLLSNGQQGLMTLKIEPLRTKLCQPSILSGIINCVYSAVNRLKNSQTCSTTEEYNRIQQEAKTVISLTQSTCERGTVPIPRTCIQMAILKITQCYSEVGLDPNLFARVLAVSNRTHIAFLGDDAATATILCRSLRQLRTCTQRILSECPSAHEEMAVTNFDYESLARGVVALCRDIDAYIQSLSCFQNSNPQADSCANDFVLKTTQLKSGQLQHSFNGAQVSDQVCRLHQQKVVCELQAWRSRCDPKSMNLKQTLECNPTPSNCLKDGNDPFVGTQTCSGRIERLSNGSGSEPTGTGNIYVILLLFVRILFFLCG